MSPTDPKLAQSASGAASASLFPSRARGAKSARQLAAQIKRTLAQEAGLDLNVHAFRHLAAMLFPWQLPGEYETVRLLLGQKSLTATVQAYCGTEQKDAVRRYDSLIDHYRQQGEGGYVA